MKLRLFNIIATLLFPYCALCQKTLVIDSSEKGYRTVIPGPQYARSGPHRFFWGKHYRREWSTPVRVPVIDLSKEAGGLTPIEQGGGRQTKTLRLKSRSGQEYVLRCVDKNYEGALPPIVSGTFIEDIANDQVSSIHPFAAITIPGMIRAAGIYHTNPRIVFVPRSEILGEFNSVFANTLCLFEKRPDDDESRDPDFGFSKDVVGTENMMEKTREEYDHQVDQEAFVRARLFDMFLGDWGRHEDQWRWAKFDSAGFKIYKPIPRDRDQTYTRFDGLLVRLALGLADIDHMESFERTIDDIEAYNFPARYLDRRFTNEMPRDAWLRIAASLQQALTDSVIETNVKKLPPKLFAISGNEIIAKLKKRRDDLRRYADRYYLFLAKEVDIPGCEENDLFKLQRLSENETRVELYNIDRQGNPRERPFYSRTFYGDETREIRLYGLKGNDRYLVDGVENKMMVRIIGGPAKDSVVNRLPSPKHLKYYDSDGNVVHGRMRSSFSHDPAIHAYDYRWFRYNSGDIIARPSYSNRRGVYFSLGYKYTRQQWRKDPFGWKQMLKGYYSFSNRSFGADYEARFVEVLGKWDLLLNGSYDQLLDNNFLGIGNETRFELDRESYKVFSQEAGFTADLNRRLAKHHDLGLRAIYNMVRVKEEKSKFFHTFGLPLDESVFRTNHFAGGEVYYNYRSYNDEIVPTKGFRFSVAASHLKSLTLHDRSFSRYTGLLGFYLPITESISFATRNGVATVTGQPEFYQLNTLGGGQTLRGFFRQRFYGKTSFFNNNDLRYIFDVYSRVFNGKMGFILFADQARVWQPGESSDRWHFGFGGGLMIVPFNKIAITTYYGVSRELGKFHFRIGRFF